MKRRRLGRERHYAVPHEPFKRWLCVNPQKGQKPIEVLVIQKNPIQSTIEAITETPLSGFRKTLAPGERSKVPNWQLHDTPVEYEKPKKELPPYAHWKVTVLTAGGRRERYYRTRAQSAAREQAKKVQDVIHIVGMMPCTAEEYEQNHTFRNQGVTR